MQPYGYDRHALTLHSSTFLLTPGQMSPFFSIPASSRRPRCVAVTTVFFKLLDTEAEAMKKFWHRSRRREVGGFPGLGGLVVGWPMHRAMKCKDYGWIWPARIECYRTGPHLWRICPISFLDWIWATLVWLDCFDSDLFTTTAAYRLTCHTTAPTAIF